MADHRNHDDIDAVLNEWLGKLQYEANALELCRECLEFKIMQIMMMSIIHRQGELAGLLTVTTAMADAHTTVEQERNKKPLH